MGVVFGLADKIAVLVYGEVHRLRRARCGARQRAVQEAYLGSVLADAQAAEAGARSTAAGA
jgi:branched-chain amino acid transport system ATP-binding protein